MTPSNNNPIGTPAAEAGRRRARQGSAYRQARARLAPYEQLAKRMGTSHSAISRIESGQHGTSVQTLQRLATALEMRFVMGFEHGPTDNPVRELVPT